MAKEHVIGSFQLIKTMNKRLILNMIRMNEPISRAEIAKQTKLTPPTVTNIVNELIEEEIVQEGQVGPSSGGRKPILLKINEHHFYAIGIDVGIKRCRFTIANLKANLILEKEWDTPINPGIDEFIAFIVSKIRTILVKQQIDIAHIVGVGIGMHGMIEVEEGVVIYSPNLNFRNVPLKALLERQLEIPVYIENDARLMGLGEYWYGNGGDAKTLVCINIGRGIGAGVLQNGMIFRGYDGIAGGISHIVIELKGPLCSCGNHGCLESLISHEGIKQYVIKEVEEGATTKLTEYVADLNEITPELIQLAAKNGDELALKVYDRIGTYLGMAVYNLIHIINPERFVIGGGMSKSGDLLLNPIRKFVNNHALTSIARKTEIIIAKNGERGTLLGAVALVLNVFFLGKK
ncbi:MAG: ROK family transcriptional regulator [Bacillaceae bacterium]